MQCGIVIDGVNYNVFCYADDILLASLSVSGLQTLIDAANSMISSRGLRFNPAKSVCGVFGKSPLVSEPCLTIESTRLRMESQLEYLGVTLSMDGRSRCCQNAVLPESILRPPRRCTAPLHQ